MKEIRYFISSNKVFKMQITWLVSLQILQSVLCCRQELRCNDYATLISTQRIYTTRILPVKNNGKVYIVLKTYFY
jgi:hypothetical protein